MSSRDFPIDIEDFNYTTTTLLAQAGMREEVKILGAQEELKPECIGYDNWNGGEWTWRFDLEIPLSTFRGLAPSDRSTMEERIQTAMRQVIARHDAHTIGEVRIVLGVRKAPPNWKADALAWAEGRGNTNQGRVRSTNIAPFEDDGLLFRSRPEIFLYRALKARGVTMAPLPVFIRGGDGYRRLEPDFVLIHRGVIMVVEVDGDEFHPESPVEAHERLTILSREGVHTERVRASECSTRPDAEACVARLLKVIDRLATIKR